jgi:hypothetical protein
MMDTIIAAGYKAMDLDVLANKVNPVHGICGRVVSTLSVSWDYQSDRL